MRQDVELETTIPSVLALRPSCLKLRVKDVKSSKCTVAYFYYSSTLINEACKWVHAGVQFSSLHPRAILCLFPHTHTHTPVFCRSLTMI